MICFNPRTRESATLLHTSLDLFHDVSIHALVRVRHEADTEKPQIRSFNPRTRESATWGGYRKKYNKPCFNPRTRESATLLQCVVHHKEPVSIHALVRVRLDVVFAQSLLLEFQSTHS